MKFNFKEIHIGELIKTKVDESKTVDIQRICNFFKCNEECIYEMYKHESIDTKLLLKWSKLLEYDFFRVYTQHQILYSPPAAASYIENVNNKKQSGLPQFRKNIYTKEVIEFILEMIEIGDKSTQQIIDEYKIPKTTLYRWLSKYNYTSRESRV